MDFDIKWGADEPSGKLNEGVCINGAGKGGWADTKCDKKKSVVCQKDF